VIILAVDWAEADRFAMCDPQEKMALALPTLTDVTPVDVAAFWRRSGTRGRSWWASAQHGRHRGSERPAVLDFIDELKIHSRSPSFHG